MQRGFAPGLDCHTCIVVRHGFGRIGRVLAAMFGLTGATVLALAGCPALERVKLRGTLMISSASILTLAQKQGASHLTHLSVECRLDRATTDALAANCPNLVLEATRPDQGADVAAPPEPRYERA